MEKFWTKARERFTEPSTYAGLASVVAGVGMLGKVNEAPGIADAIANIGTAVASGQVNSIPSLALVILGALAMAFREKGGSQ